VLTSNPFGYIGDAPRSPSPTSDPFTDAEQIEGQENGDPFDDSHQIGELESSSNENPFHDSYEIQNSTAMVGPRNVAHAEESAEVEVLYANLEKLKSLTKKIQGSMTRLEANGRVVKEAIGPIYSNTQTLQITNRSKLAV